MSESGGVNAPLVVCRHSVLFLAHLSSCLIAESPGRAEVDLFC